MGTGPGARSKPSNPDDFVELGHLDDIRQFLLLIYKAFTYAEITYDCLLKKIELESYFCTLSHKCKNPMAK